jgi:hypothetical protein
MSPSAAPTLLLALVVLAGLVLLAVTWWKQGRGRGPVGEPSCGKCGYAVRGLASLNCPECGSDLREVGIVTPHAARGAGPVVWAVVWTVALPWPALGLSALAAANALPQGVETNMRRVIFVQAPYLNAIIQANMTGRGVRYGQQVPPRPVPVTQLTLDLQTQRTVGPLTVDLATGASRYTDAAGQAATRPGPFDPAAVLAWLGSAGFDTTDPKVQARAADIHAAAREIPQAQNKFSNLGKEPNGSQVVTAHPSLITTTPRPNPWTALGVVGFWVVVWLAGIVWIVRRNRHA